jgi:hypothetical protein
MAIWNIFRPFDVYFMAIWYILWPLDNLVVIWYILPHFALCIVSRKIWQPGTEAEKSTRNNIYALRYVRQIENNRLLMTAIKYDREVRGRFLRTMYRQGDQMSLCKNHPKCSPSPICQN